MNKYLGEGAYGKVRKENDLAIKTFKYLLPLVQEYAALRYLRDCEYIVKVEKVEFKQLELYMELYDANLRRFISKNQGLNGYEQKINILLNHTIKGLIELHDRGLVHGDIKPSNILINYNPLKAVLGDCGFVSNAQFAKVTLTAARYREMQVQHDHGHDMYSLGITIFEIFTDLRIDQQLDYHQTADYTKREIRDPKWAKIILNLTHHNREERFTARQLLAHLYQEDYPKFTKHKFDCTDPFKRSSSYHRNMHDQSRDIEYIGQDFLKLFKSVSEKYTLKNNKKGYWALLTFIEQTLLKQSLHSVYMGATFMILSSVFGKFNYDLNRAMYLCEDCEEKDIYIALRRLLDDGNYLTIMFR